MLHFDHVICIYIYSYTNIYFYMVSNKHIFHFNQAILWLGVSLLPQGASDESDPPARQGWTQKNITGVNFDPL